jgi:PKD repeat protein
MMSIAIKSPQAPVANFSGTPTSGAAPLAVTFTDSSTNGPTAWSWTFGDTYTSTTQNPSHTYTAAGTYTVALTATNAIGNNPNTKTNYITATSGGTPVYQINSGNGGAISPYAADGYYSGGSTGSTGNTIDTSGVTDPAPMAVYQTERYGAFTYTFTGLTPSANYTVRLHFAEFAGIDSRIFNVKINGTQVLTNFNIMVEAGAKYKAIVKQFTAAANGSGQIVIEYITGSADLPKSSGIQIISQ